MNADERITSVMAASISGLMSRYWAYRSANGTATSDSVVTLPSSRASPNPAQKACRIAGIDAWLADISRHHRACADHHVIADRHRQDAGVGANADARTHAGRLPQIAATPCRLPDAVRIVDEHDPVRYYAVLSDLHHLTDE